MIAVVVLSLVVALAAVALAVVALRRTAVPAAGDAEALPADVEGLRREVAALRAEARDALRHLSVVRYDAFGDMGGHLSWSLALLDDSGHGVVLTSIHGRSEARTYAKTIVAWRCEQQLSPRSRRPSPRLARARAERLGGFHHRLAKPAPVGPRTGRPVRVRADRWPLGRRASTAPTWLGAGRAAGGAQEPGVASSPWPARSPLRPRSVDRRNRRRTVHRVIVSHVSTQPQEHPMSHQAVATDHSAATRSKWWTLAAVCTGVFMLLLDITIVNVALPDIQRELDASLSDLQWVIDAYALSLAALLLTAGSLADLFGRRLVFTIGLVLFTIGSVACGAAQDIFLLTLARAFQGIGGAAMFATALALLATAYVGRDRGVAFGAFGPPPASPSRSARCWAACSPAGCRGAGSSSSTSRSAWSRSRSRCCGSRSRATPTRAGRTGSAS